MDERRRDQDPLPDPYDKPDRLAPETPNFERFDERIDVGWNPPVERRRPGQSGDDHDG